MNLLEIKQVLFNRKEFNTKDTRRRNLILRKIEELETLEGMVEEETGELITDVRALSTYIDSCISRGEYVLDLETTGLDCFTDSIVGVCLYTPGERPCYIPILHTDIENNLLEGQLRAYIVKSFVAKLLNSSARMINHNIKFDLKFLEKQWGLKVPKSNIYWDTRIGAFLLNENEPTHALKPLYDKYILKKPTTGSKFSDLFGNVTFNYIPLKYAKIYGANDGIKTYKLYQFQKQYLYLDHSRYDMRKLAEVFFNIEMPLIPLLVDMELKGIELDIDRARELEEKYLLQEQTALKVLEEFVTKYESKIKSNPKIGPLVEKKPFNFNSPTQLKVFLYDILKMPKLNKDSTDKKTLDMLLSEVSGIQKDFLEALLNYKQVQKLLTSFIQKLPNELKSDGAIHGQFNQTGAKTLRFSSSDPK